MVFFNKQFRIWRLSFRINAVDLFVRSHDNFTEYPLLQICYIDSKVKRGIDIAMPFGRISFAYIRKIA